MNKETGGPAFPTPATEWHGNNEGMTLRDYFAGLAMQGDMSFDALGKDISSSILQEYASHYYRIADAMLKARGE